MGNAFGMADDRGVRKLFSNFTDGTGMIQMDMRQQDKIQMRCLRFLQGLQQRVGGGGRPHIHYKRGLPAMQPNTYKIIKTGNGRHEGD